MSVESISKAQLEKLRKNGSSGSSNRMSKSELEYLKDHKAPNLQYTKKSLEQLRAESKARLEAYELTLGGKSFGNVSKDAIDAIQNNKLESYIPQTDKEEEIIKKFKTEKVIPLTDAAGKPIGAEDAPNLVSYGAYAAIVNDKLESYNPVDGAEKTAIESYKRYVENQPVTVNVTDKKSIELKYKTLKGIDDFVSKLPNNYSKQEKADRIDKYINGLGLEGGELKDAQSYAGLKKLAFASYAEGKDSVAKEATVFGAKFLKGTKDAADSASRFFIKEGVGGLLDGGEYRDERNKAIKYYEENPDELGNDLFNQEFLKYGGPWADYVSEVQVDNMMEWYADVNPVSKFIGDAGFYSAGQMVGAYALGNTVGASGAVPAAGSKIGSALSKTKIGSAAQKIASATPTIGNVAGTGIVSKAANWGIGKLNNLSIKSAAKFLNPLDNPTTAIMGLGAAQDKYDQLIKSGYTSNQAMSNALFTGYVNAITEKMGYDGKNGKLFSVNGKTILGDASASKFKNAGKLLKSYLSANVSEGVEEIYATVFERAGDYFSKVGYIDANGKLQQRKVFGDNGIFDLKAVGESFLGGFVGGAVMGSVGVISTAANMDVTTVREFSKDVKSSIEKANEAVIKEAKEAGVENVELPKPIDFENATVEEINDYYEESVDAYKKILSDEAVIKHDNDVVKAADERLSEELAELQETEMPTVSVGDVYIDSKYGNTIKVLGRNDTHTTVEIITDHSNAIKFYENAQADRLAVNDQYRKVENINPDSAEPSVEEESPSEEALPAESAPIQERKTVNLAKVGQFYEAYGDDAAELADKLGLKIISKNVNGEQVPMVGFPLRFIGEYKEKLGRGVIFNVTDTTAQKSPSEAVTPVNTIAEEAVVEKTPATETLAEETVETTLDAENTSVAGENLTDDETVDRTPAVVPEGKILTLKHTKNIYSLFKKSERVAMGKDFITNGPLALPLKEETFAKVREALIAGKKNPETMISRVDATLDKFIPKNNNLVVSGDLKVHEYTMGSKKVTDYMFELGEDIYTFSADFFDAFNDGKNTFTVSPKPIEPCIVRNENSEIVALIKPKRTGITPEQFNALPYVSEKTAERKGKKDKTPDSVSASLAEAPTEVPPKEKSEMVSDSDIKTDLPKEAESATIKEEQNKESDDNVHTSVLEEESADSDRGLQPESVQSAEKSEDTGRESRPVSRESAGNDESNIRESETDTPAERPVSTGTDDNRVGESERGAGNDGGNDNIVNNSDESVEDTPAQPKEKNFAISKDVADYIDTKSPNKADNLEAIRVLHELENTGKKPTKAQLDALAKYKGWGGLSNAFLSWQLKDLQEVMTEEEIKAARATVEDAYYTPTYVIDAIYKGLARLGFEGGNILEPSMGIGNFFGKMPKKVTDASNLFGVEIDSISGRIASYLYPNSQVNIKGFQDVAFKDGAFDLIIGNVPFGDLKLTYKGKKYLIHDFFFRKSLDKLADGGVMAFITSKGTLDKADYSVRAELAQQADLVAAYRLPPSVFDRSAGASVATDIIILQKKPGGSTNGVNFKNIGNLNGIAVNEYFVEHPENIIGELTMRTNQFGKLVSTVKPTGDVAAMLTKAMSKLPKDLLNGATTSGNVDVTEYTGSLQKFTENGKNVDFVDASTGEVKTLTGKKATVAKDYIKLRDTYNNLINASLNEESTETIEGLRKKLKAEYSDFTKKHGHVTKNKATLADDNDFVKVSGLEIFDTKTEKYIMSEVFEKDTLTRRKPTKAETSLDALGISISEAGKVDPKLIAQLVGKSESEVVAELDDRIILTPDGNYELNEVYLSGNVREKLRQVEGKKGFEKNEKLLKAVMPEEIKAKDITPQFGAPWIEPKYIADFLRDTFKLYSTPAVNYDSTSGTWSIEQTWGDHTLMTKKYGTSYLSAMQLAEKAINMRSVSVRDSKTGAVIVGETRAAQQKVEDIKNAFEEWCFKDTERRNDLVRQFNEKFNSHRNMDFSELSKYLSFDGLTDTFSLRDYQKRAVARTVFNGNTLLAHGVGTGKTAEMIASAMELKRLGVVKKNLMVVPNHKPADFRNDILKMYPSAKVISLNKGAKLSDRQRFFSQVASGDWDICIVPHSSFALLDVAAETRAAFIQNQIDGLEEVLTRTQAEQGKRIDGRFVRNLENQKKKLETRLEEATSKKKDTGIIFEELGVDSLFVDEAHNFKSLPFFTKLSRVAGVATTESGRAENMFMIADTINRTGGRVNFATATPITNSMSEIYNMLRFLRPDILKEAGIGSFDGWASMFGSIVNEAEIDPTGRNMRMKERFSKFKNVPQMIEQFRRTADILKTGDVIQELPNVERIDVINETNDLQEEFLDILNDIVAQIQSGGQKDAKLNMLTVTKAGQMAAIDLRNVVDFFEGKYSLEDLDVPGNRTTKVAERVYEEYKNSAGIKGTQFVFCDEGVRDNPNGRYRLNVYNDLINKLVAAGIPRNEIAVAQDFEDKAELSGKVNTGEIRVLIGSTAVMGEGMNAQERAVALHHVTVPYRPSDIEQREGRIIRFGNINKDVRIYRYIQERSYDSYQWQMQERKANFINQAMSNGSVTEIEEMSDFVLTAREAKAIASGNPLLLEKMDIEDKLNKLRHAKVRFNSDKLDMQERLAQLPKRIETINKSIEGLKADAATVKKNQTDDFSIKVFNKTFTERSEAAKHLETVMAKVPKNGEAKKIGEYLGLDVLFESSLHHGRKFTLKGVGSYSVDAGDSALGNITRISNLANKLNDDIANKQAVVEAYESELKTLESEIKTEFPQAKELEEMQAKLDAINKQIGGADEVDMSNVIVDSEADETKYSIDQEGITNGGDLLPNGSGEWQGSKSARKPAKEVDGRTRRYRESRKAERERKEYCENLKASGKTEQKIIHDHRCEVIPEEHYTGRMKDIAVKNAADGITETIFVAGKVEIPFIKDSRGKIKTSRGVYIKNGDKVTIIVQYDNEFATPEQINDHEKIHDQYKTERVQKAKDIVLGNLSERELDIALDMLTHDYSGVTENNEEYLIEEFIANVLTGQQMYATEFNDLTNAFWNGDEKSLDNFKIAEYTDIIDAGGVNGNIISSIGLGSPMSGNYDIPYDEYAQLKDHIMSVNNRPEAPLPTDSKAIGNNVYIWKNRGRTDFSVVHSFPILDNGNINAQVRKGVKIGNSKGNVRGMLGGLTTGRGTGGSSVPHNGIRTGDESNGSVPTGQYRRGGQTDDINQRSYREGGGATTGLTIKYSTLIDNDTESLTPERKKEILEQFEKDRVGVIKPSQKELWGGRAAWVMNNASRVFPKIPERGELGTFFAEFRKNMIQWKNLPNTASFMTIDKLNKMTEGLTPEEFKTFSELVYFLDLQEEAQIQRDKGYTEILLPNEITPTEVDELVKEITDEASDKVKKALEARQEVWSELKDQYVELNRYIGFDTDGKFKRKNYYHHQVIEHMNNKGNGTGGSIGVKAGRGWLKERQGSTKAINTDFLAVEHQALLQMQYDTYIANTLGKIKQQYDIKPRLEDEAFRNNKKLLNDIIKKECTDDDGNMILDSKGKPDSETYRQQLWYNSRIMFGFSGLFDLAEMGALPTFGGEYSGVVNALANRSLSASGLYNYVGALASLELDESAVDADEQMVISARTVLKYTSQKKAWAKELLGDDYQTWETLAKSMSDKYTIHQPRKGNYFYVKTAVDEDAFNQAFNSMINTLVAGDVKTGDTDINKLFTDYSETVRLMGAKYEQWVLPNEIVETMQEIANPQQRGEVTKLAREMMSFWKGMATSVNPLRTVKFGLRNMFGDLDAVIAGNPKVLVKSKQAVEEIFQAMKHKKYTPEFMEWVERGGYSSMIFANEMDTETQSKLFKAIQEKKNINVLKIPTKVLEGYLGSVEAAHNFREAILRYSAYLYFKDAINKNGGEVKDYTMSNRYIVKGLNSVEDKAYQLSKDMLGAYDEVGKMGQTLRRYWLPFYSFTETNLKRYYRLFENVIVSDASIPKKAGKFLLKGIMANMLFLLMAAWNRLVMKDEDDELPTSARNVPHLTLGKFGDNVYAFRQLGSFSELLEWVGLDDYKWTEEDLMAPVDKVWGMVTPAAKAPVELFSGLNFYPSLSQPSAIRDKWQYFFNTFGVDELYNELSGKPAKGWGDVLKSTFIYDYDYKESAYYEILDVKREYQGDESGSIYKATDKSNALYYMKQAVRYKDKDAALKYLDEYFENGGTGKGIKQSISMMNPIYGFTGKDSAEELDKFIATLTDEQKEKLKIAQDYYENDLMLPEKVSELLGKKDITDEEAKNVLRKYINSKCK